MANTYKGKVLGFIELLTSERVEIPIIQRDYAQGRRDKGELRVNFLRALLECIQSNSPIKLDFIYGSRSNGAFQPLDGQQRLTTLYLLHWYAALKDGLPPEMYMSILKKFTYETRITSRDFCLALISNKVEISEVTKVSDTIVDSNWFFLSWKNDPTVDSMLRTIDDIHKLFFDVPDLWAQLNNQSNLISFYYVELENIGLTDDLYIKMNARGKLLTPFENFKASFQKFIEDQKWEYGKLLEESFALKIDTKWTDYLWQHFRKNNTIDEAFIRLIAAVAMIRQIVERTVPKVDDKAQHPLAKLQEEPNSVRPENFTKASFDYLIQCFEIYQKILNENVQLGLAFPMWRHIPRKSIFHEIVFNDNIYSTVQVNSATYSQKVLFFAQTEYLRKDPDVNNEKFTDWMRVVRNIVSRGDVDKDGNRPDLVRSPQSFESGINLINELADFCDDIYSKLAKVEQIKSQFAKEQVEEERQKARLIEFNPDWKILISEAEDNGLLMGRIGFLFYCIDYQNKPEDFNAPLFGKVKDVFNKYFASESCLDNDLRRAFLCMDLNGNYEFYGYWWSYWNTVGATKRRLFDKFRELEYYLYGDYKEYFKKLVLELIDKDPKQIAADFSPGSDFPNWKLRLIKESSLLDDYGKSNYIAIESDNSACWLLKSKRPRDTEGCHKII